MNDKDPEYKIRQSLAIKEGRERKKIEKLLKNKSGEKE